jgi:hypothetical protein
MNVPQNDVVNITGREFFDKLQEVIGTEIPILVRNVLLINDVDRAILLSRFDKDSITAIENFIKHDFTRDMVPKGEKKENYLGKYMKQQDKFTISLGHKMIIDLMVDTCRKYTTANVTPTETVASQISNDRNIENHSGAGSSIDDSVENYETVKQRMEEADADFAKYIGSLLITIFNDAKRLTLSGYSWPSRHVAAEKSHQYRYRASGDPVCKYPILNYVTPTQHKEFLNCIVESDCEKFKDRLKDSLALSIRVDGSVDRTQDHNVYVMGHLVNKDTTVSLVFIGFGVPKDRKAEGYFECVKCVVEKILPWESFLPLISSIVTDGEELNLGCNTGLHVRMLAEIKDLVSDNKLLLAIWCYAHRINLAWKDVCNEFPIIAQIVADASSLSSHFHKSGERTSILKRVAAEMRIEKPLRYVTYFPVRWTQYVFDLLYVTLRNWRASMEYFVREEEIGLEQRWLQYDRLHATVFLTDVLQIFKCFQKKFESETVTLLDVQKNKQKLFDELEHCLQGPVANGWEELFLETVECEDGMFYGHELSHNTGRSIKSPIITFNTDLRASIVRSIMKHVDERLECDVELIEHLKPLDQISSSATEQSLKLCYDAIIPDLNEDAFYEDYKSAAILLANREIKSPLDTLQKLQALRPNGFSVLKIALARVVAAKPHSSDVERLIGIFSFLCSIVLFGILILIHFDKTLH